MIGRAPHGPAEWLTPTTRRGAEIDPAPPGAPVLNAARNFFAGRAFALASTARVVCAVSGDCVNDSAGVKLMTQFQGRRQ
jgi:hypothetical protein